MKTVNKKYKLLFLLLAGIHNTTFEQSKSGIENYQYMAERSGINLVSVVHHRTKSDVYTELRYNYEELHTASVYAGKTLYLTNKPALSFTPMAGIVVGKYTGGSLALNTELEFKKIFFSSQSQYTVNKDSRANSFFYNWSELGYYTLPWFYTGVTIQQTILCSEKMKTVPGFTGGFTKNKWSVPVYFFNPFNEEKYFMVGINFEWERVKKINKKVFKTGIIKMFPCPCFIF